MKQCLDLQVITGKLLLKRIIIKKLFSEINYCVKKPIVLETEIYITTPWKAFLLLNPNYNTTLFYFEGNAELVAVECSCCTAALKCLLVVLPYLVPIVKLWELPLDKDEGVKKENLVKDYFFLLKLGQELSTQGPCMCWEDAHPPWWQPQQHLEGLRCFWTSNLSETLLILQR